MAFFFDNIRRNWYLCSQYYLLPIHLLYYCSFLKIITYMKKPFYLAVAILGSLASGSLTSCQDEDFDVSTAVLQERAFEQGFIKEFGKPSADQTWDFYAQKMASLREGDGLTRATMDVISPDFSIQQPTDNEYFNKIVKEIGYALEEKHDNSEVGQNNYTLTSTGDFKIYAVRYAGYIEVFDNYKFEIGYIDEVNNQEVPLFGSGFRDGFSPTILEYENRPEGDNNKKIYGNPGWAAEVKIPKNTKFHFYLKCNDGTANGTRHTYYSNQKPDPFNDNTWEEYGGCSTLLYSAEYIDIETGKDEQVMMIGFEDAWHMGPDLDFNDVVLLIEGQLPLPAAKRFFCEDLKSYDYDFNDVVFDVMSTGIVLRAVGGSLPVFLRVTNRLGNTTVLGELHELMLEKQFAENNKVKKVTYKRVVDGDEKTFYKSIDVSGYEINGIAERSVWLDPVQIVNWTRLGDQTTFTRLDEDDQEVDKFSVDKSFPGKVELIVLDEYAQSYDKTALLSVQNYPDFGPLDPNDGSNPINTTGGYKLISLSPTGAIPAMFIAPVSAKWMKEMQKITLGYPNFYGKTVQDTDLEGHAITKYWYETGLNAEKLYNFRNDEPDEDD